MALPKLQGKDGTTHRFLIKRPKRNADDLIDALTDLVRMEEARIDFHGEGFLITARFTDESKRDRVTALEYMRKCLAERFGDVALYPGRRASR